MLNFFILIIVCFAHINIANASVDFKAKNAMILDYNNFEIIYNTKNIREKAVPSSMTKVMTSYLIFELLDNRLLKLDDKYKVSIRAWRQTGSRMYLEPEKQVTIDDLLKGMIVQSGNDSAVVLAEGAYGGIKDFVNEMNDMAKKLGMKNTHYANPNGLFEDNHYMSTYDTALLMYNLIKNHKTYYDKYYSIPSFTYNNITQRNRNVLINTYKGMDGGKTGHTDEGGYSMVSSAVRHGQRFIVVVNGLNNETERAKETEKMFDYAFSLYKYVDLYKKGEIVESVNVIDGDKNFLNVYTPVDIVYSTKRENITNLKVVLVLDNNIKAPILKDSVVGYIVIQDGEKITKFELLAKNEINKLTLYDKFVLKVNRIYRFLNSLTIKKEEVKK